MHDGSISVHDCNYRYEQCVGPLYECIAGSLSICAYSVFASSSSSPRVMMDRMVKMVSLALLVSKAPSVHTVHRDHQEILALPYATPDTCTMHCIYICLFFEVSSPHRDLLDQLENSDQKAHEEKRLILEITCSSSQPVLLLD